MGTRKRIAVLVCAVIGGSLARTVFWIQRQELQLLAVVLAMPFMIGMVILLRLRDDDGDARQNNPPELRQSTGPDESSD
jgi:hypothetical protein